MRLYEMLNITCDHCNFLLPSDEYVKQEELKKHGKTLHYDIGIQYEGALFGLLKENRKEIIKSFNNIALFLVYIDIITWNYNSISLTLAPYFQDSDLMMYNLEMFKLFEFFKSPFVKYLEQMKKNSKFIADGVKNKLIEPSHLKSFQLFPHMAMFCENQVKIIPLKQSFEAQKAQINLWNNQELVKNKGKNIEGLKGNLKQIPLELWKDTGIYAEDLIDMGYSPKDVIGKFPSEKY